jgi:periplasmic divalent cation tolerance protein
MRAPSARVVLVTHPPRGARAFARRLVERRLAACVNLVPLASVYRWHGQVEGAREVLLVTKTTAARVPALERWVRAEHPYECPEFVVLAAQHVAPAYARWLAAETRPPGRG